MKKQTKRLFYVIAIAIMVAVISVACKKKPTAVTEFQIADTENFDTNKAPDPVDPTLDTEKIPAPIYPTLDTEKIPAPVKPEQTITEDTALLKGKDGVYTDKANHRYNTNMPITFPNGAKGYKEYNNYLVTITVANGAVSLSGGPFNDYDYKNLKPYTKTWGDGFKALYKDGKEVAHVKIDGNTIQVHVSALGNLIFKATR